ncbi:MAG TPA: LysE family translocator [Burkholderiaceae bacterium]|nr:LysE family translocator [Burkholderiaceae bacterium]
MGEISWWLFIAASLILIATPGQDMILVMSRSVAQGAAAGVATAAGVSVGLVGHTALASLGLGALLRASEWLFVALKLVGAAYLVYLAFGLLRTRQGDLALAAASRRSLPRLFVDGALSNLSNPKIAIFYFAFLPQFVITDGGHTTLQLLALGLLFAALTFLVKAPVGISAGALSAWLRRRPRVLLWLYRSSSVVLLALGVRLAFERRN